MEYTGQYEKAIRKNYNFFAAKCMKLKSIILSEISQEKDKENHLIISGR